MITCQNFWLSVSHFRGQNLNSEVQIQIRGRNHHFILKTSPSQLITQLTSEEKSWMKKLVYLMSSNLLRWRKIYWNFFNKEIVWNKISGQVIQNFLKNHSSSGHWWSKIAKICMIQNHRHSRNKNKFRNI